MIEHLLGHVLFYHHLSISLHSLVLLFARVSVCVCLCLGIVFVFGWQFFSSFLATFTFS